MSVPFEDGGIMGTIIEQLTTNITGDVFLSMTFLVIAFFFILMGFGMPNELNLLVIMPMLIVLMAFSGQFVVIGVLALLLLAGSLARTFFVR